MAEHRRSGLRPEVAGSNPAAPAIATPVPVATPEECEAVLDKAERLYRAARDRHDLALAALDLEPNRASRERLTRTALELVHTSLDLDLAKAQATEFGGGSES